MTIQFNSSNNITTSEATRNSITEMLTKGLKRFEEQITRVEVFLTDEDASKNSDNDKKCVLEVRLKGMQPTVVSNNANTQHDAAKGAIDKLKTVLGTAIGKLSH